jgi:hypothetical protein
VGLGAGDGGVDEAAVDGAAADDAAVDGAAVVVAPEVLELQAGRRSPAAKATATMPNRPGPSTVARMMGLSIGCGSDVA